MLLLLLSKTENGFKELVKQFSVQLLPSNTKIIKIIIIISISKQLNIARGKDINVIEGSMPFLLDSNYLFINLFSYLCITLFKVGIH